MPHPLTPLWYKAKKLPEPYQSSMKSILQAARKEWPSWSKIIQQRMLHDFNEMIEHPRSKEAQVLWTQLNPMHATIDGEEEEEEETKETYEFPEEESEDFTARNLLEELKSQEPTPSFLLPTAGQESLNEVEADFEAAQQVINQETPTTQQMRTDASDAIARAARESLEREQKNSASSDLESLERLRRQQLQNLAAQQARPTIPLPIPPFPTPLSPPVEEREEAEVKTAAPSGVRPVFEEPIDAFGGGEQYKTLYCGLDPSKKPPGSIWGNRLQCLRKGYAIGSGHIRS